LFHALDSPRDVAKLLELSYGRLVYHLYRVPYQSRYTEFTIAKRSGGARLICAPATALKIIQQKLNTVLSNVYRVKPSVFGYAAGRSIVLNAQEHRKQRWVLNIDLENFFPSINFGRVRGLFMGKPYNLPANVATVLAQICCYKNSIPQGAPTSPIISNMICAKMDSELQRLAGSNRCFYTRYADDITLSTSVKVFPPKLAFESDDGEAHVGADLLEVIETNGFHVNPRKIRLQPKHRRQQVTGLIVNATVNVRRSYRRQVRAMLHAWEKHGLAKADEEFRAKYDRKHRNPKLEPPAFKQVLKGKIEFFRTVRGGKNSTFIGFIAKFRQLERREKGIKAALLRTREERPIWVFAEGKTDKQILVTAWNKLYDGIPLPFDIRDSNPLSGSRTKGPAVRVNIKRAHLCIENRPTWGK